eukprot:5928663-Pleurochrysis_carterae.AAC.1
MAHEPRLRTRREAEGASPVPREWARYLAKHNALATFSADLMTEAEAAGADWAVENPEDCGDREGVAWWEQFADHAPLWMFPAMRDALEGAGEERVTFATVRAGRTNAQVHDGSLLVLNAGSDAAVGASAVHTRGRSGH